ncbi:MAG: Hsp20/alpha crystallin family protein [Bacteroidota bacterium]|nr:Hsp20/alpha crystallin family protein [Bacteroidota bacterium]
MTQIIRRPRSDAGFFFPKYMRSFFDDLSRDFDGSQTPSGYVPRVDISEDSANIYVHAELPGMSKEDVKVTIAEGILTLRGEKKHEEKKEDKNYFRIERRYGEFVRQFTLPDNVKEDSVRANFTNGVLEITIPKSEPEKPKEREVPINVNIN